MLVMGQYLFFNRYYIDSIGIPISVPFSQSRDSGLGISNPGIPAGLWYPGGIRSKTVIIEYMGLYC